MPSRQRYCRRQMSSFVWSCKDVRGAVWEISGIYDNSRASRSEAQIWSRRLRALSQFTNRAAARQCVGRSLDSFSNLISVNAAQTQRIYALCRATPMLFVSDYSKFPFTMTPCEGSTIDLDYPLRLRWWDRY